jgi:hypothetical protein
MNEVTRFGGLYNVFRKYLENIGIIFYSKLDYL